MKSEYEKSGPPKRPALKLCVRLVIYRTILQARRPLATSRTPAPSAISEAPPGSGSAPPAAAEAEPPPPPPPAEAVAVGLMVSAITETLRMYPPIELDLEPFLPNVRRAKAPSVRIPRPAWIPYTLRRSGGI
jgi:hypothetical protein